MTWQEYQEAVAALYEQAEGLGEIKRNLMIPDRITGQNRQVDAMWIIQTKGHALNILIDAKFHSHPIDVKEVESVCALANAVGASKSIIVALNGWTDPAMIKSGHLGCDLRILTLDDALDLIVPDKWMPCPSCQRDCVVMDQHGLVSLFESGQMHWWMGGACRECLYTVAWCQDCGVRYHINDGEEVRCHCGYLWFNEGGEIDVYYDNEQEAAS